MLAILPGTSETADQSTRAIWDIYEDHLADEYGDVKVLAVGTVTGNLLAATRDVSTMEGLKGAKIVPCAAMTSPIIEALGAVPVQMPVTEMYTGLSDAHRAIIDEVAGLPMSLELAKSFDGADARSKKIISETTDKNDTWVVVSDEERAKMDAAVARGLEQIFVDYEGRGISDAREIYGKLNK